MKKLLVITCFILGYGLQAQQLYFTQHALFYDNQQLGLEHIVQDDSGLIYVTSGNKIFQFDGVDYQLIFTAPDATYISYISNAENKSRQLWVGLSNGTIVKQRIKSFEPFPLDTATAGFPITGFVQDAQQNYWVATYGKGLFFKRAGSRNWTQPIGLPSPDIYQIDMQTDGTLWFCTDQGLSRCRIYGDEFEIENYNQAAGLDDEIVRSFVMVGADVVVGTQEKGLFLFDNKTKSFSHLTPNWLFGAITKLVLYGDHEIWIMTERKGVYTYNLVFNTIKKVEARNYELTDKKRQIMIDREGNVWLTSQSLSLERAFRSFEFYEPSLDNIQHISVINSDQIILGTDNGLFEYNLAQESVNIVKGTAGLNIISFDKIENSILFGTFDRGVFEFDHETKKYHVLSGDENIKNNSVISIAHSEKFIWLSTLAGVYRLAYKLEDGNLVVEQPEAYNILSRNYSYDILVEHDESIFFATDGDGIAHLTAKGLNFYKSDQGSNQILSLTKDKRGLIWSVDLQSTLCHIDRDSSRLICDPISMGKEVSGIASDTQDHIYILHEDGIDILNSKNGYVTAYGEENGLDGFSPQLNAISTDPEYGIYIAANDQLLKLVSRKPEVYGPELMFNYVKVGEQDLDPLKKMALRHNENTMHINLIGLHYSNPEAVSYRYKLIGHDNDWKYTADNNIIYSRLAPGDYTFSAVPVSNILSDSKGQMHSFSFVISRPLWQRPWFIVLAIIGFGFVAFRIMRYREKMISNEKEAQKAVLERQYEVLKNQLNPHFLFNAFNTLVGYIEEDPETAVEVVGKLSDFYRKILVLKEHKLIRLHEEIDLLNDYVYLLNKRFGNNLRLKIELNGSNGLIPPMTLQLLVENAVKHNILSSAHPLDVEIAEYDMSFWRIKNNIKPKRNVEQSTGIGLHNIDKRYRLLGKPPIQILRDNKSFTVLIPKIQSDVI